MQGYYSSMAHKVTARSFLSLRAYSARPYLFIYFCHTGTTTLGRVTFVDALHFSLSPRKTGVVFLL